MSLKQIIESFTKKEIQSFLKKLKDSDYRSSWKKDKLVDQVLEYNTEEVLKTFTFNQLKEGLVIVGESMSGKMSVLMERLLSVLSIQKFTRPDGTIKEQSESENEETLFDEVEIEPVGFEVVITHVKTILGDLKDGDLILAPSWQRGDVWQTSKKKNLIKSLLLGIPLPSLIVFDDKNGKTSVLDGKQRLTAIQQFVNKGPKSFKLPNYKRDKQLLGFKLKECSGKSFDELPEAAQKKIRKSKIALTTLRGLDTTQIYIIFELYNTSGTRLNAAEIRNAVYRNNRCHQLLYELSGDGSSSSKDVISKKLQKKASIFSSKLRNWVYNYKPKEDNRFNTLDFIERYVAYSRCPHEPGSKFKILSTAKVIRAYYEYNSESEDLNKLTQELLGVEPLVEDLYVNVKSGGWAKDGKFHALSATTAMICTSMALVLINKKKLKKDKAKKILEKLSEKIEIPQQQTGTIWSYQAQWVLGFYNNVNKTNQRLLDKSHGHLIACMQKVKIK